MAARHFTLDISVVRKRLSEAYGVGTPIGGALDIPYRQLFVQAEADAFLGGPAVTAADYGFWISSVAASTNSICPIGPFDTGPIKLSDLFVIANGNSKLHILALPY